MKEETNLDVRIISVLQEDLFHFEPDPGVANWYTIIEVKWFDFYNKSGWNPELTADPLTYDQLQQIRKITGYIP